MFAMKPSRLPRILLTVVALALIVVGCAGLTSAQGQEGNPTDPFSNRMGSGEGTVVEWSGYAQGHRPGEESTFELTLHNEGQETWSGLYCVQLLARDDVVATLVQAGFSLQPGQSWSRQVPIRFPDGLAEGAYGLALTVPGRLSSVTTIQVGEESEAYGGPWPESACQ
jgi:hypothetical protein